MGGVSQKTPCLFGSWLNHCCVGQGIRSLAPPFIRHSPDSRFVGADPPSLRSSRQQDFLAADWVTAKKQSRWPRGARTRGIALIKAHLCRRRLLPLSRLPGHAGAGGGRRPEPGNQRQDVGEHLPRHSNLSQLKGDVASVADGLYANLDQLLAQAGQ